MPDKTIRVLLAEDHMVLREGLRTLLEAEADINKRGEKLGKAWAYAYDETHYIPVFKQENIWGIAKNLEWKVDIAGRPFFADMRFTN